jgi:D-alanyl-D-alanine carboxypeptidase
MRWWSAVLITAMVATLPAAASAAPAVAVPPLDPVRLEQAIAGLPNATVTSAQVTVTGSAGTWTGTSGVADVASGAPVPADGRFRIGSATKMFTAALALQLVAEHRLDLDRPVQRYLPGVLPASYPDITVGRLLDHTSGLPFSLVDAEAADPRWFAAHRLDSWTPRQVVASATAQPMAQPPGTGQRYNGVNYYLAGLVIEKITGHPYGAELHRRILRPLGLRDTYLPAFDDARLLGRHAHGYVTVDGSLVDVTEQSAYGWAEGGMISTRRDLIRFVTALFRGRVVPAGLLDRMFTPPDLPYTGGGSNCRVGPDAGRACYTVGLQRTTFPNGVTVFGKSGSVPGYTTAVFATRDLSRVAVYSLTPTGNRDGSEGRYVQNLAAASFDPSLGVAGVLPPPA